MRKLRGGDEASLASRQLGQALALEPELSNQAEGGYSS